MIDTVLYAHRAAFDNASVVVRNSNELTGAIKSLASQDGGTILLDASAGHTFYLNAKSMADDSPDILIKSLDDAQPAEVSQINIIGGANLTLSGLNINSASIVDTRAAWYNDVNILDSHNITFAGNTMTGRAEGFLNGGDEEVVGQRAVMIRNSEDVRITDNTIADYYNGITYLEVQGLDISRNDISGIQGDGMRGGGIQDVTITDNYLHDFLGSMQTYNHSDMIQIWGTANKLVTQNVEISGNILDAGNGAATQSILIQNEDFERTGYFDNITIRDNLIHNGMAQGIGVNHITNLEVIDNTVLWNPHSTTQVSATTPMTSTFPRVILRDAPDAVVTGNITGESTVNETRLAGDNAIISFTNPEHPMYAGDHFVNLSEHGDLNLQDLALRPESSLFGTFGAQASTDPYAAPDAAVQTLPPAELAPVMSLQDLPGAKSGVVLSAEFTLVDGQPIDPDTAAIRWIMGDGTEKTGLTAMHMYDIPGMHEITLEVTTADGATATQTRLFETEDPDLVELDFSSYAQDISAFGSRMFVIDPDKDGFVEGRDGGKAFELTGLDKIEIDRTNDHLAGLDTFKLDIGFALSDVDSTGYITMLHKAFTVEVVTGGTLRFTVDTQDGYFVLFSDTGVMDDTDWHDLSFSFDGPAGEMTIAMDGEVLARGEASGTTTSNTGHDLVVGSAWSPSVQGSIDHYSLTSPTSAIYGETAIQAPGATPEEAPVVIDTVDPAAPSEPETTPKEEPVVMPDQPVIVTEPAPALVTTMTQSFMTMFEFRDDLSDDPGTTVDTVVDTNQDTWAVNLFDILSETGWHSETIPAVEADTSVSDDPFFYF